MEVVDANRERKTRLGLILLRMVAILVLIALDKEVGRDSEELGQCAEERVLFSLHRRLELIQKTKEMAGLLSRLCTVLQGH